MLPAAPVTVQMGQPVMLTWTAPTQARPDQDVDRLLHQPARRDRFLAGMHGAGHRSFTVTAEMTTELFKNGVSGFPSVTFTRQSGDTTTVMSGCTQLLVRSPVSRELNVPGVVSCSDDKPCPNNRMCREDLTCAS
jgi:hypothetical protein